MTSHSDAVTTDNQTHSPGPWTIDWNLAGGGQHEDFPQLFYAGIKSAGETDALSLNVSGWWRKPDTYLIAAAPDLFGICKDVLDWVHGKREGRCVTDELTQRLVAAIAKAEGKL